MKVTFNVEHLRNIHRYHTELARQIDDADWIGESDSVDHLRNELQHVKDRIARGDTYYPDF